MNNKRIEYIDIAKGIGIILVIFGHVVWGGNYTIFGHQFISNFIYSFHMPLFFVISGLCIKESKTLDAHTIKKIVKSYLIPYFIWTIIYMLGFWIASLLHETRISDNIIAHSLSICGLAPLWFLLSLFISEFLLLAIKPLLKNSITKCIVLLFFVGASVLLTYLYSYMDSVNIWFKNYTMGAFRIFPTTFFVIVGYVFKEKIKQALQIKNLYKILLLCILCTIQVILCLVWNEAIDVQVFLLSNPLLYFVKSINGTMMILVLSSLIHSKMLIYIGNNTKELMILHYPPFYYTLVLSYFLDKLFEPNIIGAIIITILTIACCLVINHIMKRFKFWNIIMGEKVYYENK